MLYLQANFLSSIGSMASRHSSMHEGPYPTHPHPRGYVANRADPAPVINGRLDLQPCWLAAPWSEDFIDIQGPDKEVARLGLLWCCHNRPGPIITLLCCFLYRYYSSARRFN